MGPRERADEPGRRLRVALLISGVVLPQLLLFAPSFLGTKLLLPLDLLARPKIYLPQTEATRAIVAQNRILTDPIQSYELSRIFAAKELRAGRLPLWNPHHYTGAPFAIFPKYSPFNAVYYLFPTPRALPWMQLLQSLVAGIGAYVFFRRVLALAFWPAAWCYPLTGFFVLLQGYVLTYVAAWLPWMLWLTDRCVRRPRSLAGPGLAVVSLLVVVSGQLDASAHVLLASGIYATWCLFDEVARERRLRAALSAALSLVAAWALGLLLAGPYLLPLLEYAPSGVRLQSREGILADRPPMGLSALPEIVLPDVYGSHQEDSLRIPPGAGNRLESAAPTYAGLVATLLLAPLALASRRHRRFLVVLGLLTLVSLAWQLDIPLVIRLFDLPVLDLRPHNRFVFVASFAILAAAAIGLHALFTGEAIRRRWLVAPAVLLAVAGGFAALRALDLPEPIATQIEPVLRAGGPIDGIPDLAALRRVQEGFRRSLAESAALAGIAAGACLFLLVRGDRGRRLAPLLGGVMLLDLIAFAWGVTPQTDPALYYPRVEMLEKIAAAPPGRILCLSCLPPRLNETHGLDDVRGYDGVQPARLLDLLDLTRDPRFPNPDYARTQLYVPTFEGRGREIHFAPVLDLLGVRYGIFRGEAPAGLTPAFEAPDYWALENPRALPRAFVPNRVESLSDERQLLWEMSRETFAPAEVAYVDGPVHAKGPFRGEARIVAETPTRVEVAVHMQTAGVLVLADLWDPGWRAELDGREVPVLRADHALRAVEVPAGSSEVVFRYAPASLRNGVASMAVALAIWVAWIVALRRNVRGEGPSSR